MDPTLPIMQLDGVFHSLHLVNVHVLKKNVILNHVFGCLEANSIFLPDDLEFCFLPCRT